MSLSKAATIKDVAKKAGVSIATVSRYINKFPLKEENRIKVEKAVLELSYQPLAYARRLAGGKLNTYGLIIPGYEGIFYSFYALEIMREIAAALDEKSIDLHLHIFWNRDTFRNSVVEGVIMADIIGNEAQLERLIKDGIPLVIMNRNIKDLDVSFVAVNNFKGAYDATEFLINHGHKNIAHLAGDTRVQCAVERIEGYKAALEKNKIEIKRNYIKATNFSRKEAREQLEDLFSGSSRPTAIFCCSDEVASEVLSFAEENNIVIPKNLSVIGFDDNPHCIYGNLMLTTVRQPLKAIANHAVKMLREQIEGNRALQKVILDTELIIRDTVSFL